MKVKYEQKVITKEMANELLYNLYNNKSIIKGNKFRITPKILLFILLIVCSIDLLLYITNSLDLVTIIVTIICTILAIIYISIYVHQVNKIIKQTNTTKKGEIRFLTDKVIDKTMNETIEIVNNDIKGIIITKNFIIIVGNKNKFIYLPIDIKEKVLKVLDRYLSNIDIIYVKKD